MKNFVDQCNVSLPHAPHDQRWPMGFCPGIAAASPNADCACAPDASGVVIHNSWAHDD